MRAFVVNFGAVMLVVAGALAAENVVAQQIGVGRAIRLRQRPQLRLPQTTVARLPQRVGSPTGWDPRMVLRGAERDRIKQMPIELRPNRPLHFYGNSVRRSVRRRAGY